MSGSNVHWPFSSSVALLMYFVLSIAPKLFWESTHPMMAYLLFPPRISVFERSLTFAVEEAFGYRTHNSGMARTFPYVYSIVGKRPTSSCFHKPALLSI
jgi:hypothetical protein